MKLTGEQRIAAPKARVWEALNDPQVLERSIPGCQSLERDGDKFRATVALKIGPMDARFAGAVTLADLDPPNACTIIGQGQGGPAGFAKGAARVSLAEDGGGATLLSYDVDAQVGGRLAQLGGPIIDATAKQLAGQFFKRFSEIVGPAPAPVSAKGRSPGASFGGLRGAPAVWVLSLIAALLAGLILGGERFDWSALALGLVIIVTAALGFEFGRRSGAPVIVLDPALLKKLMDAEHKE